MNTNIKGNIGLTKVIADITEKGYEVYLPISDYLPVDLIMVDSKMNICRLQVKYRNIERNKIIIPFSSVINGKKVKIDFTKIDGWAVYVPESNQIYYISVNDIDTTKTIFSFRLEKSIYNQPNESPLGDKFLDIKRLWKVN